MVKTIAERQRANEQSKARLAEAEARLKVDARKQRTRRLVEAGALVEKTGLLELDSNALFGALLSLRDGASDTAQVDKWATLGGRTFAREAKARDMGRQAVLLRFGVALPKDATQALRKAGFRYSKIMQHWEGLARVEDAEALARSYHGTAHQVGAGAPVPAATTAAETIDASE